MKEDLLLNAANAAANQNSVPKDLGDLSRFSIQVVFSDGSLQGTLKLQASNDNSTWSDVDNSSETVTAGGSHIWNVNDANYRYVRVVWTASAGTGTLTARCVVKENPVKEG